MSALDVSIQAEVLNLLAELKDRLGLTMMFISHDLSVVEIVSDRVMVLYLGRVMEIGPTADVYERPRHPYTAALLSAAPGQAASGASASSCKGRFRARATRRPAACSAPAARSPFPTAPTRVPALARRRAAAPEGMHS